MVGEKIEGTYCPICGEEVINDGFDSYDNLTIKCHCSSCDWDGREIDCVDIDSIKDDIICEIDDGIEVTNDDAERVLELMRDGETLDHAVTIVADEISEVLS